VDSRGVDIGVDAVGLEVIGGAEGGGDAPFDYGCLGKKTRIQIT
jgi:hypothetical protein